MLYKTQIMSKVQCWVQTNNCSGPIWEETMLSRSSRGRIESFPRMLGWSDDGSEKTTVPRCSLLHMPEVRGLFSLWAGVLCKFMSFADTPMCRVFPTQFDEFMFICMRLVFSLCHGLCSTFTWTNEWRQWILAVYSKWNNFIKWDHPWARLGWKATVLDNTKCPGARYSPRHVPSEQTMQLWITGERVVSTMSNIHNKVNYGG